MKTILCTLIAAVAFWKAVIGEYFNSNILPDWHPQILAEKAKVEAANAEITRLKVAATQ
jgi:hypothetical protein